MREISKAPEIDTASRTVVDDSISRMEPEVREVGRGDVIDLLTVLSQNKKVILRCTLGAALIAALVAFLLPKTYTAKTTILPPEQKQSSSSLLLGQLGILGGLSSSDLGLKNPDDLFIAMLQSRSVEDHLIDRFDLRRVYGVKRYQDARKKLEDRSYIVGEREGTISVSVTDRDPKRAADLANSYIDELRSLNQNLAVTEAGQRRLFYQQKLDAEREDLARAELAMELSQQKNGMIQPEAQGRAIIEAVASARADVAMKEVQLQAMRTYATANNPDLKRTEEELAGLRSQLAKMERSTGGLGNGNLEIPTGQLPEVQLQYIRRARDLKYHEALYEFLGKQLEAARIDEAKAAIVVQVVDQAVEPEKKSGPHRLLIVLIAAGLAFLVACLCTLMAAAWARKEQDPQERLRLKRLRDSLKFS